MYYKPDWEQARHRMVAYWNHSIIDRACIAVHAPRNDSSIPPAPNLHNGPWLLGLDQFSDDDHASIDHWWQDPEENYRRMITWFENSYFAGEALPVTYINWGAMSMAAMLGSPAEFSKTSVWYPAVIHDWNQWNWHFDEATNPTWRTILHILERLVEGAPGNYLVGKPELGCGSDVLSLMRGMDKLAMDLLDHPQDVKAGVDFISDLWVQLMTKARQLTEPVNEGGDLLAWMGLWAPGKLDQIACDFSTVISPAMFREFFVPEIVKMGNWCDYGVFHLDGPACMKRILDSLLEVPQIKAIQFTPGAGAPPTYTESYIPRYRKILESGRNLYLLVEPDEVEKVMQFLPPEGLFMRVYVDTQEQADDMLKKVTQWSARRNQVLVP